MRDCYYERNAGIADFEERDSGNNHFKWTENRDVRWRECMKKLIFSVYEKHQARRLTSIQGAVGLVSETLQPLRGNESSMRGGVVSLSIILRVTCYLRLLRQSKCLTDLKTFSKSQNYDTRNLLSCLALDGENIRSIVHQKDKLFTVLDYARNFGSATKEGLTRGTNWAACYFSNSNSWCPLLECAMILSAIPVI